MKKTILLAILASCLQIALVGIAVGDDVSAPTIMTDGVSQVDWQTDYLTSKGTTPVDAFRGWGNWADPPSVYANSSDVPAVLLAGAITVPPRSVVVHPGEEDAVVVNWRSPIAGKVSIQARVVHVHPSGGNGVAWTIAALNGNRTRKVLLAGVIDRGGARVIPLPADDGKLDAVVVENGEGLQLEIAPRENYACCSTLIEFIIGEVGGAGRVWNLSKDVCGDIQAGNPHADALGNAAVWHFLRMTTIEDALVAPAPTVGIAAEKWTPPRTLR